MDIHDQKIKNLSYLVEDRAGSIVERLTEKLKTLILTGELPEGYAFPNEMELCEYLHVGRSTLRETYKALASSGLISRSKRGTVVNSSDVIAAGMPYHMLIQAADFSDILEFRTLIEKETARIAATRATAENKKKLADYLDKMKQSIDDAKLLTMYDTMFHLEIAHSTQNLLISRILGSMIDVFTQAVSYNFTNDEAVRRRALHFHESILQAIVAGDAESAHSAMQSHLRDVVQVADELKGK
jgi:GntR family transcriptional repressor for pyruvate dehydrogenase complex